MEKEIVNYKVC